MRKIAQLSLLVFLILLFISIYFYKERLLFLDCGHILFRILNEGALKIEERRYGSFITQGVPWLLQYLHAPIKWIAFLYSISFNVFYFLVACVLYRLKKYELCLLLGVYFTAFVSDSFFWTNNEIHQGIAWLLLTWGVYEALITAKKPPIVILLLVAPLLALSIWTHPLVMLSALFIWFFRLLQQRKRTPIKSTQIVLSLLICVLAYLKFDQSMHHGYDSGKIEIVTQYPWQKITQALHTPVMSYFLQSCFTIYWPCVLLSLVGIAYMLKNKQYLLTAYCIAGILGYLLLLGITYPDVIQYRFYIESEYMGLAIFTMLPFIYGVLPQFKQRTGLIVLSVYFVISIMHILNSSSSFTPRTSLLASMYQKMEQKNIHKLIVTQMPTTATNVYMMTWGTPTESILYGCLKGDTQQRTFIVMDSMQLRNFHTESTDTLLSCFEKKSIGKLASNYFHINHTETYDTLSYEELMR